MTMIGNGGNGGGPGGFGGGPAGSGGTFGMDGADAGDNSGGGGGGANGGLGGAGQGGGAGGDGGLNGVVTTPGTNAATILAGDGQDGEGSQLGGGGGGAGGYGLVIGAAELSGNAFTNSGNVTAGSGGDGGDSLFAEGGSGGDGGIGIYLTESGATLDNSANIKGGDSGRGGDVGSYPPLASATGVGGDAGSGVVFAGSGTLINEAGANITGGNGGRGGIIEVEGPGGGNVRIDEPEGATGAGVTGAALTIVNLGTIAGGIVHNGRLDAYQFDSITFTAGANTMALGANASFHGAIDLVDNATTLTFDQSAGSGLPDDATLDTTIIGAGSIIKVGAGALTLSATGSTFTGTTDVQAGTLLVDGSITNSIITVESGATLGGHGTVGSVTVESGGHFAAGNSPGVMHTGDLSLMAGSSFDEEIGGTAAGSGYDQTVVTGTVALNGATLNLSQYAGFVTTAGQTYTIIDNDGSDAVTGTFSGLAEGATVTLAGETLKISYVGGDGNDVVLTDITPAQAQSFVVTTLDDVVDPNDGLTSLREAIDYANSHANADANTPDVITFASGLAGTIHLSLGTLVVTDAVKIDGDLGQDGKPKIVISGDANGDDTHVAGSTVVTNIAASRTAGTLTDNVQIIRTSADLTLDGLVLTGGTATGSDFSDARGGAVGAFDSVSPGTPVSVTATATTFVGNSAVSSGGAISASGTVTLDSSTVSGNISGAAVSGVGGGGVFASTVSLTNATISGNDAAGSGGGVFGTAVSMVTSTLSGNHATDAGGGVFSSTNVNATNSIISGNDADTGNDNSTTPLFLHGLNVYGEWLYNDSGFVDYTSMGAVFASVTANPYTGVMSGTLADNGGPVETIALKADPTNPALDSGRDTSPGVDARGLTLHDYSGIPDTDGTLGRDLGAFELQDNIASIAKNDAINILGVTVAYNPVVSVTTQAVIAEPGAEFQDGDLVSNLSGTQLVLSSANDFYVAHDYTYTLTNSQFVFTSVNVIDGGEYGANVAIVNGALVVHDPDIYGGEDVVVGFAVGLKEGGSFSGDLFADNGNGADSDPDGDAFSVTKINGTAVTDGQIIALPSGALLTIHTDGTFSYDTNHVFDGLNDGQTATESFTYAITGGGTATMSFTVVGEGSPPPSPSITIDTIAGDDVVNAAEGAATITVSGSTTNVEDGQTVTLWLKTIDGSTGLQSMTTTVSSGAWHIDLPPGATPAFPDGPYLITADVSNQAEDPAPEASRTITVDTTLPSVTIDTIAGNNVVNAAEGAATIAVSGLATGAEDGQVVTLALKTADGTTTLQTMTTTVSSGAWHIDLPPGATPAFPDGPYLVTADVSDAAGNPATEAARTITVDTHAPSITISTIAGDDVVTAAEGAGTITVSGLATGAEDGQVVTLALKTADGATTLQTMTTTVSGGAWHLDLPPGATPAFPDGPYLVTADVSDAAGNPATEAARTITVDTAPGTPPLFERAATGQPGPHGGVYATPGVSDGFVVVATGDFNGDGNTDVLWRDGAGRIDEWNMQNESWATSNFLGSHGADWQVAGTGDFNGDGTDDILFRQTSTGKLDAWIMQNGQWSRSVDLGSHGTDWTVIGIGDFNGDHTGDILFQNTTTGAIDEWVMADGNWSRSQSLGSHSTAFSSVAVGDFDGDGTADVLWHDPTTGQAEQWHMRDGQWAGSVDLGHVSTAYDLAGVNDFNGDGTSDVLWHNHSTGQVDSWVMDAGQWFASVSVGTFDPAWQLAGTGDFNHNGSADIFWHNQATGDTATWLLHAI
jgi:CSLREA domain-containing protein